MPDISYTQRLNYFTKSRCWILGEDRLDWEEGGRRGVIDFEEIREVRMAYAPTRFDTNRQSIKLITAKGVFEITNLDWRGPMKTDDLSDAYNRFVEELHERMAARGSRASFAIGAKPAMFAVHCILSLVTVFALVAVGVYFLAVGVLMIAAVKAMLILFFLPTLYKFLKRNRPLRYEPGSVPWNRIRR